MQRIPFEDHAPPLLCELLYFCQEASRFLASNDRNVIAVTFSPNFSDLDKDIGPAINDNILYQVHCKGGKGRTGVAIASLLLLTGHRKTADEALELFASRRTADYDPRRALDGADEDLPHTETAEEFRDVNSGDQKKCNQGVDGPSQKRYVHYLEAIVYGGINPWRIHSRVVNSVTISLGRYPKEDNVYLSCGVTCQRSAVFDSLTSNDATSCQVVKLCSESTQGTFAINATVW